MSIQSAQKVTYVSVITLLLFCPLQNVLRADVTASILGNARDASSAPMPNVKVTVSDVNTNFTRSTVTDSSGEYRFLSLPIGSYTVQAELSGFQTFIADKIELTVDQQRRLDIVMQVGSLQQKIEVTANAVQVETTATQLGQVIDNKQMLGLPLNGRSYIDLLTIQGGVAPQASSTGNVAVNGQRGSSNSFMVNGGDVD